MGYNAAVLGGFTTIKISQNGDPEMTRLPTFYGSGKWIHWFQADFFYEMI